MLLQLKLQVSIFIWALGRTLISVHLEIISFQSMLVYAAYIVYPTFMYKVAYICHFKKGVFTIGIINWVRNDTLVLPLMLESSTSELEIKRLKYWNHPACASHSLTRLCIGIMWRAFQGCTYLSSTHRDWIQ